MGHSFPLFPDVSIATGRKFKQVLWCSPYFTCKVLKVIKKKSNSAAGLPEACQKCSLLFFWKKEHTHLSPSSQQVPVTLPIVNSPQCIFSSTLCNHTNLCQTLRDLNYRRQFFLCCSLLPTCILV